MFISFSICWKVLNESEKEEEVEVVVDKNMIFILEDTGKKVINVKTQTKIVFLNFLL